MAERVQVDAKDFQEPLEKLANTLVLTLTREGHKHISAPPDVPHDIAVMLRYSVSVYRLLFYLNADTRRRSDPDWNERYGVTGMQLVRSLIDCLYNITRILEKPAKMDRRIARAVFGKCWRNWMNWPRHT